jgi:hypothetical protein
MKRLRIYFPDDHSSFTSKPLDKKTIETKIYYILNEGGFEFFEDENGNEMLVTKDLLNRTTITLI